MEYRKLSEEELSGKIMTKEIQTLFGNSIKTYVRGGPSMLGDEYTLYDEYEMYESRYTLDYDTEEYSRGSMYTYRAKIPRVGLVITSRCNGYGSGRSMSYFVTKVIKKKGRIMEFECLPIYWYTPEFCYFNLKTKAIFVQSGNKNGYWKPKGSKLPLTSAVDFGVIDLPNNGFDK